MEIMLYGRRVICHLPVPQRSAELQFSRYFQKSPTFHYFTFGRAEHHFVYYNRNSANNMIAGVLYRLNRRHDNAAVIDYTSDISWLRRQFTGPLPSYGTLSYEHALDFVARHPAWNEGKKNQFLKMARRVCALPLATLGQYVVEGVNHDVFIKDEPYPPGKAPRVIANAQPAAKVILALLLDHINDWFFSQSWTVKHYDIPGRVAALRRLGASVINVDHTSFECSVDSQRYGLELAVYRTLFGPNPLLESLFMRRIRHGMHFESKSGLRAALSVVRASGDFDTSLGNSIINLLVMHHAIAAAGCTLHDCLVEGDDGVFVVTPRPDLEAVRKNLLTQGFEPKLDYGPPIFCGLRLDEYGYTMDILKVARKLLMHSPGVLHHREYQHAAMEAAILQCPDNPVFMHMARQVGVLTPPITPRMYAAHFSRTGVSYGEVAHLITLPLAQCLQKYIEKMCPIDAYECHSQVSYHAAFYTKNHTTAKAKQENKWKEVRLSAAPKESNPTGRSASSQVRCGPATERPGAFKNEHV